VLHRKPVHFGQRLRRAEKKSSYGLVVFHAFSKCLERTLSCPIAWLLGVFLQCSHPLTRSNDAVPGIRGWQVLKYPLFQRYRLPWISPLCTSVARDWHGALRHVQRCCSRLLVRFLSRGFASATPTRMRTVSQSRARSSGRTQPSSIDKACDAPETRSVDLNSRSSTTPAYRFYPDAYRTQRTGGKRSTRRCCGLAPDSSTWDLLSQIVTTQAVLSGRGAERVSASDACRPAITRHRLVSSLSPLKR
jgi:hypothetical protein